MDTFLDIKTALQQDLKVGSDSTFYSPTVIGDAANRAYRKVAGLYRWPQTEEALKTSTQANQEYYDYPDKWRPNSIWKLSIDGQDYGDALAFKDYLYEKDNSIPSGLKYMWSNHWLQYFIYPTPTLSGNNNIVIWGIKMVDAMVKDDDTTIFSYAMNECNEALELEAFAILKNQQELIQPIQRSLVGGTLLLSIEASNILTGAWRKIQEEQSKYHKTTPFFDVPDFFGRRTDIVRNKIGDF